MAYNHASVAAHAPQSLPPFAQAFSNTNLNNISSAGNSLPPIQSNAPANDHRRVDSPSDRSRPSSEEAQGQRVAGKKRTRADITSPDRDEERSDSERKSPRTVQIKEEQEQELLEPSTSAGSRRLPETVNIPSSVLQPSPSKRRRATTLSGALNLNTDIRPISDQTNSTPISPVVRGFTVMRDDPAAIEQVRSSITISQQQKALIEQRRGSVAGIVSPVVTRRSPPYPSGEERTFPKASAPSRRRSPNPVLSTSVTRRGPGSQSTSVVSGGNTRLPSPGPIIVPSQQPHQTPPQAPGGLSHTLPPPPISFARRRAGLLGTGKKKPADIVISPREAHTKEQFAPAIQSAPPIPQAGGQAALYSSRFPMTLPRLPSVIGGESGRRVGSGVVPPTPTRLSMQRANASSVQPISGLPGRSPPVPQVPISSTLVPPTPSALHHAGDSGDKSAFLAPFEIFYDALNDSKQLKNWLGDQLAKSNSLIQTLTQQQERLNETIEAIVEKRTSAIRNEMLSLRRRVDELEDALRDTMPERPQIVDTGSRPKGKQPLRNGVGEALAFPPLASSDRTRSDPSPRHMGSPSWVSEKERDREYRDAPELEGSNSPAPFDTRRLSTSAARLDHSRPHPHSEVLPPSTSPQMSRLVVPSPPQSFREGPGRGPSPLGKHMNNPGQPRNAGEQPSLNRQHSSARTSSHRAGFQDARPDSPESRQPPPPPEGTRRGENREQPHPAMDET